MSFGCLAAEGDSGSNTSVEADVDDEGTILPRHSSTTSSSAAQLDTGVAPRSPADEVRGSVNVFVVDSKATSNDDDGASQAGDMRPLLLVRGDVQPAAPSQTDPDSELDVATVRHDSSRPVTGDVRSFHPAPAAAAPTSGVDETASGSGRPLPPLVEPPTSKAGDDVFPVDGGPGKAEAAAGEERPLPAAGVAAPPVLVLSPSVVGEFLVSWFDAPWLAYVVVVVAATLLAALTQPDPAHVIVVVLIATGFCFCLFPPPDDECPGDDTQVRSK